MDLLLVSLLLQSLLILPCLFQGTQAVEDPTDKYSEYLIIKDVKEDMKRRRKQARIQPISLKPPPQDWPEPELAPGDFLVPEKSEVTSLSPLIAYQAKLEQEYERQKKEKKQKVNERTQSPKPASEYTSSEEDLQKLLNPDELIKHNKMLRSVVGSGKLVKPRDQVLAGERQGRETRPGRISSMTALKAKSAARKTRKKSLLTSSTAKPRRGRRKKTIRIKESENNLSSGEKEIKKSRSEGSYLESQKINRRRKNIRGFTFAEQKYESYDKTRRRSNKFDLKPINTEHNSLEQSTFATLSSAEKTQQSTENIIQEDYRTSTMTTTRVEDYLETTELALNKTTTNKLEMEFKCPTSPSNLKLSSELESDSYNYLYSAVTEREDSAETISLSNKTSTSKPEMDFKSVPSLSTVKVTTEFEGTSGLVSSTIATDIRSIATEGFAETTSASNETWTIKPEMDFKYSSSAKLTPEFKETYDLVSKTTEVVDLVETTTPSSNKTWTIQPEMEMELSPSLSTAKITPELTEPYDLVSTKTELPNASLRTMEITTLDATRHEIRERRKEMKKEMGKVLKAEELEGSFSDKDSDWTTSEKRKIPISLVTPRHAIMGLLKHKVVNFIDTILKNNAILSEDQRQTNKSKEDRH